MKIKTIMIVDDSEADQLLTSMTIEEYDKNIEVLQAYDGEEALELLNDKQISNPDVVILDINMPRMTGLEFLEEYSKNKNQASVVAMLTSSEQKKDRELATSYDCVKSYFVKLLDDADMEKIISL